MFKKKITVFFLVLELGFDKLNIESEKKITPELKTENATLRTKQANIKEEIEKLQSGMITTRESIERYNETYQLLAQTDKSAIERLINENDTTDLKMSNLKEKIKSLRECVARQTCTRKEMSTLVNNLGDLQHKTNLINGRQVELRENIEANGLKSQEAKRKVEALISSLNANIRKLEFYRPEYSDLFLRETVLIGPVMFKVIPKE